MNFKFLAFSALMIVGLGYFFIGKKREPIKELQGHMKEYNTQAQTFFGYDPELELMKTKDTQGDLITVSAHGYGASKALAKEVIDNGPLTGYIVTLNLPDHDHFPGDGHIIRHGTIDEILPYAYAVSKVVQAGADRVNLHGHSAGGGVVINLIGLLNSNRFDAEFNRIGITSSMKRQMLSAIQKGVVILDTPLKSAEEIIETYGSTEELELFARNYRENKLRPIDSIEALKGLKLHIHIYFENPDEILCNRDDEEFVRRLKEVNSSGITEFYCGKFGGHRGWHEPLWQGYVKKLMPA